MKRENNQMAPTPGAALIELLKQFQFGLLSCEYSRELSQILDCVDCLLLLAERERT